MSTIGKVNVIPLRPASIDAQRFGLTSEAFAEIERVSGRVFDHRLRRHIAGSIGMCVGMPTNTGAAIDRYTKLMRSAQALRDGIESIWGGSVREANDMPLPPEGSIQELDSALTSFVQLLEREVKSLKRPKGRPVRIQDHMLLSSLITIFREAGGDADAEDVAFRKFLRAIWKHIPAQKRPNSSKAFLEGASKFFRSSAYVFFNSPNPSIK